MEAKFIRIPHSDDVTDMKEVRDFIVKHHKFVDSKKDYAKMISDKCNIYRQKVKQKKRAI